MALAINRQYKALYYDDRSRRKACDTIVVHSTASNNAMGAVQWFMSAQNKAKSSAHYIVGQKGEIWQMVEEEDVAWHAGKSEWIVDGKLRKDISYYSIGIEVAADNKTKYTIKQLIALVELCNDIMARRGIKRDLVLKHSEIAPNRKKDPYEVNLDWTIFKNMLVEKHWSDEAQKFALSKGWITQKKDPNKPPTWGELLVLAKNLYES